MTELLDAADSSPVSWRLEPKWLRDSLKRQNSMDLTESPKAADSSRVSQFGTVFNDNVDAQIFGKMAGFDLREDPFEFEVKPKTNGHVDLLDFAGILFEIRDRQEQVDELKSETKRSGKFLSLRKMWECVKNNTDNQLEEYDTDAIAIVYFNYFWFLTTAFLVCCTKSVEQGLVMKDIIANELCFTSFDTADIYRMYIQGISAAAATCSDLPCTVTDYEGTVTVDHWITFNNETSSVEYLEDSCDNGVFKTFKTFFQIPADFLSSSHGMVGWQNALLCKQKQKRTIEPVFRPSQQQQQKATALALGEVAPNDEYGSYTSEGMYNDLNDGRYEKTIPFARKPIRTISGVFGIN